ncbi:MAG TPA: GAF domain-containing protein [Thermomicrobiales bacterium]|nr:GAF domain-containing protein [Thermomicrobiales bacterium]
MSSTQSIKALGDQLRADLFAAYSGPVNDNLTSGQPLREAFSAFGRSAALSGISLEDTMAASADALQELFDRVGGGSSDPTTMLAAGIALAAGARAYQGAANEALSEVSEPAMPTQISRLAALHRVNRAVAAHLELGEMLETTVRVVSDTTGADACALFLYDAATDSLALRAAVGLNAASVGAVTIRPGVGITGHAARERRSIAAPDAHVHEAMFAHSGTGDQVYASQLSVPMVLRGADRLVGVLNILSIDRRDFDPREIAFLETIAGEVTVSIENARLYSQTDARLRRKVAELGTLQRVSRTVASTLDLAGVLRLIAEQAVELMNAEAAAIFRLPHKPGCASGDVDPTIEHFVGDERQVVNSSRDRLVREVVRTGSSQAVDIEYTDGMGVLFCLPLRSARETLGALCLRLRPEAELTEDELGLLQAFSDSASLAIENAQLYQDARHGLETASALLQEMHHRVRNNLQTVAALLSLQLRTADDAPWATALREAVSRIQAIAGIHDLLSDERRLGGTTVDVIAQHVVEDAYSTLIPPGLEVGFTIEPSDVTVPSRQATILALLINELISNAVSHGFEDRARGHVIVRSFQREGQVTVEVENDGESVPADFVPAESRGLGMKIVQRLVTSDLRGSFKIESPADDGTIATITFPLVQGSLEPSSQVLEGADVP